MSATSAAQPSVVPAILLLAGCALAAWLGAGRQIAPIGDEIPAPVGLTAPDMRVDLNTAGPDEIALLPAIGPRLAQRIVEHRAGHGRFETVDDLAAVAGIGPRTIQQIRPHVVVSREVR
jgi:competence protein ComEA